MDAVCVRCFNAHLGNTCFIGPRGFLPGLQEQEKWVSAMLKIMEQLRNRELGLWNSSSFLRLIKALRNDPIPSRYSEAPEQWRQDLIKSLTEVEDEIDREAVIEDLEQQIERNKALRPYFKALEEESSEISPYRWSRSDSPRPSSAKSKSSEESPLPPSHYSIPSESEEEEEVHQDIDIFQRQGNLVNLFDHLKTKPGYAFIDTPEWRKIARKVHKKQYSSLAALFWDVDMFFESLKNNLKGTKQWPAIKALMKYWKAKYREVESSQRFRASQSSSESSESEELPPPKPIEIVSSEEEEQQPAPRRFGIPATTKRAFDDRLKKHSNVLLARRTPFRVADLKTLLNQQEPNDTVMDAYATLINDRDWVRNMYFEHTVYVFEVSFYKELYAKDRHYAYERARDWTSERALDVFLLKKALIPIYIAGSRHRALAVINFVDQRFEYYDSLGVDGSVHLHNLRLWLQAEHQDKRDRAIDLTAWTEYQPAVPEQTVPEDSGLFVLQFEDCLAAGVPFDFQQSDMPALRYYVADAIVNHETLPDTPKIPENKLRTVKLHKLQHEQLKGLSAEWAKHWDKWQKALAQKNNEKAQLHRAALDAMLKLNSPLHIFYDAITKHGGTAELLLWSRWQQITNELGPVDAASYARLLVEIGPLKEKIAKLSRESGKLVADYEKWEQFNREILGPLDKRLHRIMLTMQHIDAYSIARGYSHLLPAEPALPEED